MKRCSKCGGSNSDNVKFCSYCGNNFSAENSGPVDSFAQKSAGIPQSAIPKPSQPETPMYSVDNGRVGTNFVQGSQNNATKQTISYAAVGTAPQVSGTYPGTYADTSSSSGQASGYQPTYRVPNQGSQPTVITDASQLPEKFKPISPWGYVGLNLLMMIPIIGWICFFVFTFSGKNINRRNYVRSFWCALFLYIILAALTVVVMQVSHINFDHLRYVIAEFFKGLNIVR